MFSSNQFNTERIHFEQSWTCSGCSVCNFKIIIIKVNRSCFNIHSNTIWIFRSKLLFSFGWKIIIYCFSTYIININWLQSFLTQYETGIRIISYYLSFCLSAHVFIFHLFINNTFKIAIQRSQSLKSIYQVMI